LARMQGKIDRAEDRLLVARVAQRACLQQRRRIGLVQVGIHAGRDATGSAAPAPWRRITYRCRGDCARQGARAEIASRNDGAGRQRVHAAPGRERSMMGFTNRGHAVAALVLSVIAAASAAPARGTERTTWLVALPGAPLAAHAAARVGAAGADPLRQRRA